ncbi:unnamed protein product [Blepharisma stoltei]|uniref:Uncharacterized protein n=1 Tax=Blepharisma stoltei TaxID=1481888 RepID=A0AAU9JN23_9CILI|nr:unnamed protein product [Blepharisma stoltei]
MPIATSLLQSSFQAYVKTQPLMNSLKYEPNLPNIFLNEVSNPFTMLANVILTLSTIKGNESYGKSKSL